MPGRRAEHGSNQQRAEFVTVQPDCMGLIVQAGAADMRGRGVIEQVFLHRIPVEPGDGAQPPGDGGPGPAAASRSRVKHSMSARRAWNRRRWCWWHQLVY